MSLVKIKSGLINDFAIILFIVINYENKLFFFSIKCFYTFFTSVDYAK